MNELLIEYSHEQPWQKWKWPNSGRHVRMAVSYRQERTRSPSLVEILCRTWTGAVIDCGKWSESELQQTPATPCYDHGLLVSWSASSFHSCYYAVPFLLTKCLTSSASMTMTNTQTARLYRQSALLDVYFQSCACFFFRWIWNNIQTNWQLKLQKSATIFWIESKAQKKASIAMLVKLWIHASLFARKSLRKFLQYKNSSERFCLSFSRFT
jgi:hypothetical protein